MTGLDIRINRKKLGLSQGELAEKVGVNKNTIYNYENGGVIPKSKISIFESVFSTQNEKNSGDFLEGFLEATNEGIAEVTRYLYEKNDILMKDPVFKQYIKSNLDVLEIEEKERELEEKKKIIREELLKRMNATKA